MLVVTVPSFSVFSPVSKIDRRELSQRQLSAGVRIDPVEWWDRCEPPPDDLRLPATQG
jgi:hypothetical protein